MEYDEGDVIDALLKENEEYNYPPHLFDNETRAALEKAHGYCCSFMNDDEMNTFFHFYKEDVPFMFLGPAKYTGLMADGRRCEDKRLYKRALLNFTDALKFNPVGIYARLGVANCYLHFNRFEDSKAMLNQTFPFITSEVGMREFYLVYSFLEDMNGRYITAAACLRHMRAFDPHGYAGYAGHMKRLKEMAKNADISKKDDEAVMKNAGIPYITPAMLTKRRIDYGVMKTRRRDEFYAIVNANTKEVIAGEKNLDKYDNLPVTGYQFSQISEALAYASTDGRGQHLGMINPEKYRAMLDKAITLEYGEEYQKAYDLYFEAAALNPAGIEARLGGASCQIQMKMFKEARLRLTRLFQYVTDEITAMFFYTYYAQIELADGNTLMAAACAALAQRFHDSWLARDQLEQIKAVCGQNYLAAVRNPELALMNSSIPLLTKESLKKRLYDYGITAAKQAEDTDILI